MIFDFSAIMVLLVAVSGAIWALDAMLLAPKRRAQYAGAATAGDDAVDQPPPPIVVDYARSFFPIFLIVLILRSFIVEPFRIPSGSMIPTLLVGDFILVNKFQYGIRLPVLNTKIIEMGEPDYGDVVVFRYPRDPSTPFIKRVVGRAGDKIVYRDRRLFVNGEEIPRQQMGTFVGIKSAAHHTGAQLFSEELPDRKHEILLTNGGHSQTFEGTVPSGHYFVLGDNRDNSRDSRYWGYVPDENLVGRAFMIWMNWDGGPDLGRIGSKIR